MITRATDSAAASDNELLPPPEPEPQPSAQTVAVMLSAQGRGAAAAAPHAEGADGAIDLATLAAPSCALAPDTDGGDMSFLLPQYMII
jgi:hypothetical protein